MEEQALSVALKALRKGQCIAILDLESREAESNLFFLTTFISPLSMKTLRTKVGGWSYTSLWLMKSLLPLVSLSLERYPLPTHFFFYF
jgi:3,4-dihydroxy-2-butanone 4-phosphate synthase